MSRSQAALMWLEGKSDWLSPIIVKEVRQVVRGREFNYSFGASLVAGLAVAFFGAADAVTGSGTSGRGTFGALMGCLALLGLGVVPLGAFSALRNERMEQTLELITLTALSPRRVVIGKLLAQAVKLGTLFAAIAPFMAMSFLLGGIDFVTILVSLAALFMWSLWACAVCLFLSTLFKSRAMSGLVFGGVGIVLLIVFGVGRTLFYIAGFGGGPVFSPGGGRLTWWVLAIATTACVATMINFVLLAENRLSLPTENRVTPLRLGFLGQFLLIAGWTLSFLWQTPAVRSDAIEALGAIGGLHLGLVAMFTVTEDLALPRRLRVRRSGSTPWRWLEGMLLPGGGRGALYVLANMGLLLIAAWMLGATRVQGRWLLAICGYICFFTGVPSLAFRVLRPEKSVSLHLRVAVLLIVAASMVLPDLIYYVLWRPDVLSLSYSPRHLLNPMRTLSSWDVVEGLSWFAAPVALGTTGLIAYLALIFMGTRDAEEDVSMDPAAPVVQV